MTDRPRQRLMLIVSCGLLMAAAIYVAGESVRAGMYDNPGSGTIVEKGSPSSLVHEGSGFLREEVALSYLTAAAGGGRSQSQFRLRRAYPGSPPIIPHVVTRERSYGGKECLTCHANGGYVPRFNAFTPVTPHPDLLNCRQCHNPARTDEVFRASTFVPTTPPAINRNVLPTSPPPIPHRLEMRDNCLACHAGPGAVPELRTTHPQRINCRQCHALSPTGMVWERPKGDKLP